MGKSKKKVTVQRGKKGARPVRIDKDFVRRRREELGIASDSQLAERCDMTRQNLWRVLNYEGSTLESADFGSLWYIAQALECAVDDLVVSGPGDSRAQRKAAASKAAGAVSCLAAVAISWFVSATWYTLDRTPADWALVFASSSAIWFVVYGVVMRQWFLVTNLATHSTAMLFLLPGRLELGHAVWLLAGVLGAYVAYSGLWVRMNWFYDGGVVHWQPAFAFDRWSQLQTLLPPNFGVMAIGVILGGLAASILEWAAR